MSLLSTVRYHGRGARWRTVIPIYDARECPQCGALVSGAKSRIKHRNDHEILRTWQHDLLNSLEIIAENAGLTTERREMQPADSHDNLRGDAYNDQDDDDD